MERHRDERALVIHSEAGGGGRGRGRRQLRGTRSSVRYFADVTILNLPTPQGRYKCPFYTKQLRFREDKSLFQTDTAKDRKTKAKWVHLTLGAKTEAPATRKTTACIFSAAYLESPDQAQRCGTDASCKRGKIRTWERRQSEPLPSGKT